MRSAGRTLVLAVVVSAIAVASAAAAAPGALDGSYGSCGVVRSGLRGLFGSAPAIVTMPDASLVAVSIGYPRGSTRGHAIGTMRLMPDGRLDTGYGRGGTAHAPFPIGKSDLYMTGAAAAPGGKIVVAGYWSDIGHGAFLARLDPGGSLDPSFGSGGLVRAALPGAHDAQLYGLDVDASGRVVVAGVRDGKPVVARFSAAGAPDGSFGGTGVVTIPFPTAKDAELRAVRVAPDGTIVAGGQAAKQFALARLRDGGTLDPAFGSGGTALGSLPAAATVEALLLQRDGGIVAAGTGENINGDQQVVARFGADGTQDTAFAGAGFAFSRPQQYATQIVAAADGSLLVAGQGIARYAAGGAPDRSFGGRGTLGSPWLVGGLALLPDGAAIAAIGDDNRLAVARHATGGPALAALGDQPSLCGPALASRRLRGLLNKEFFDFGEVKFYFTALEPTRATWRATATVGKHTYRLGSITTRTLYPGGDVGELPLSKADYLRLRRAGSAHVVLTGTDRSGRAVTAQRDLRR